MPFARYKAPPRSYEYFRPRGACPRSAVLLTRLPCSFTRLAEAVTHQHTLHMQASHCPLRSHVLHPVPLFDGLVWCDESTLPSCFNMLFFFAFFDVNDFLPGIEGLECVSTPSFPFRTVGHRSMTLFISLKNPPILTPNL